MARVVYVTSAHIPFAQTQLDGHTQLQGSLGNVAVCSERKINSSVDSYLVCFSDEENLAHKGPRSQRVKRRDNIYLVNGEKNICVNIICKIINLPIEKPKILLYNYFERRKANGAG